MLYKSPFTKRRIGKANDGGYVIVDLPGNYDLFLAGGIANDISFEDQFLDVYPNTTCYAFDGTVQSLPKTSKNIQFVKKNLGINNNDSVTNLDQYMNGKNDIFMKIDIEGHEFRILPDIIEKKLISKVKQLIVEIHSPGDIRAFPDYFNGLGDITNDYMFNLIKKLNNTHTIVHFHANNGCRMQVIDGIHLPHVFELTFIRNDYVEEKIRNTEQLPTKLDMPNIPSKPDYSLNGYPYTL